MSKTGVVSKNKIVYNMRQTKKIANRDTIKANEFSIRQVHIHKYNAKTVYFLKICMSTLFYENR